MCYPEGEFRLGSSDVMLGQVDGSSFYISAQQLEKWGQCHLLLDAVAGRGGMLSLDNGRETRFLLRVDRHDDRHEVENSVQPASPATGP